MLSRGGILAGERYLRRTGDAFRLFRPCLLRTGVRSTQQLRSTAPHQPGKTWKPPLHEVDSQKPPSLTCRTLMWRIIPPGGEGQIFEIEILTRYFGIVIPRFGTARKMDNRRILARGCKAIGLDLKLVGGAACHSRLEVPLRIQKVRFARIDRIENILVPPGQLASILLCQPKHVLWRA